MAPPLAASGGRPSASKTPPQFPREKVFDTHGEFGIVIAAPNGWVAQLVEQGTENPRVRGSTPFPPPPELSQVGGHVLPACFFRGKSVGKIVGKTSLGIRAGGLGAPLTIPCPSVRCVSTPRLWKTPVCELAICRRGSPHVPGLGDTRHHLPPSRRGRGRYCRRDGLARGHGPDFQTPPIPCAPCPACP